MRRGVIWAFTLPLVAGSVLVAHALAYAIVGAPGAAVHAYMAHAPQLVAVLSTLAACGLALHGRGCRPTAWHFGALGLAAFVGLEHLERVVHTGELPWLLTRPEFLLGLVFQLPVALLVWMLARMLLDASSASRAAPPRLPWFSVSLFARPRLLVATEAPVRTAVRGPPTLR